MQLNQMEKNTKVGEIQIADEVVAVIASLAATEVKGVSLTSGSTTNDFSNKIVKKHFTKGVKVQVHEQDITLFMQLIIDYGYPVGETALLVQEKIKNAIESMTGLKVKAVNIRIVGVNIL